MTEETKFVADVLKSSRDSFIAEEYVLNNGTGKLHVYAEHYLLQPIELNVFMTMKKPKMAIETKSP